MNKNGFHVIMTVCFVFSIFSLGACVSKKEVIAQPPAKPLELSASIEQGLSVYYTYAKYRHIDDMPSDASMISEGEAGQPVKILNHRFKRKIFGSKSDTGVGVFLKGYLKMDRPGNYSFKAMSNDGVRVSVNGKVAVIDPTVHFDRISAVRQISIDNPGWYELTVKYFQRKGGARLELYWQPPGVDDFVIVPAEAYGHTN